MGVLIAVLLGAVIGGVARVALPRHTPRRIDVATILAAVGATLGVLAGSVIGAPWVSRLSAGTFAATALGASAILTAFDVLPRTAPSLTRKLPGRTPTSGR
jgi:uncharacterized membrane protein YeaQ/YmgE (transglycosylase-associated protein family)